MNILIAMVVGLPILLLWLIVVGIFIWFVWPMQHSADDVAVPTSEHDTDGEYTWGKWPADRPPNWQEEENRQLKREEQRQETAREQFIEKHGREPSWWESLGP